MVHWVSCRRIGRSAIFRCIHLNFISPKPKENGIFSSPGETIQDIFQNYMQVSVYFCGYESMRQLIEKESELKEKALIVTVDSVRASRPHR